MESLWSIMTFLAPSFEMRMPPSLVDSFLIQPFLSNIAHFPSSSPHLLLCLLPVKNGLL